MPVGYETMGKGEHKVLVLHGWFGDHRGASTDGLGPTPRGQLSPGPQIFP